MSKLDPALFLTTPEDRIRIKARTEQLIKLAGGPGVFQHVAGVPTDMLSKYGSRSEPNFINAAVIVALDRQLGAPLMLGELAAMLGYRLEPIDGGGGDEVTLSDVTDLRRADSDVSLTLMEALEDGVIDISERRKARTAIASKVAKLHRIDRKLAKG
ncbi:hypothetical protein [Mesorhizobium sp. B2-3-4]|uniref:hypothetical protein n=1 Tax=Mesorhizobium sp. B2-3-4 TaxID=2589959 RepID=UPI00112EF372|nr:hypothetical protein [Mesorhizobium sp. B2-3-4]TPM41568.1 hypothetical protein FJ967_01145 [Mesorhizobium sp. B2-3-4]